MKQVTLNILSRVVIVIQQQILAGDCFSSLFNILQMHYLYIVCVAYENDHRLLWDPSLLPDNEGYFVCFVLYISL